MPVGLGIPAPFDEEKVTNYEIGWKAGWADGHLRTQFNAYYNDYENFQVIVGYPRSRCSASSSTIPNTTKIYGFEAQIEAVFGAFSLDAGLGWMQSELGKFFAVDPRIPSFGACDPQTGPASAVVHRSGRATIRPTRRTSRSTSARNTNSRSATATR